MRISTRRFLKIILSLRAALARVIADLRQFSAMRTRGPVEGGSHVDAPCPPLHQRLAVVRPRLVVATRRRLRRPGHGRLAAARGSTTRRRPSGTGSAPGTASGEVHLRRRLRRQPRQRGGPPERWTTGGVASATDELQFFTDSTRNARLDGDGNLVITARRKPGQPAVPLRALRFTSARLLTRAYLRRRPAAGSRPASRWPETRACSRRSGCWARTTSTVMENLGSDSSMVRGAFGDQDGPEADRPVVRRRLPPLRGGLAAGPDRLVGGRRRVPPHRAVLGFDEPFTLALSLAVGGDRAGEPRDRDRFPQRMIVDFVKVRDRGRREAAAATTPPRPSRPPRRPRAAGTADHPADHGPPAASDGSRSRSTRPASWSPSTASPTRCSRRTPRCPGWEPPALPTCSSRC